MNSEMIRQELAEIDAKKAKLEKELITAIEQEQAEQRKNLFEHSRAFIMKLWELYWTDENDDDADAQKRLDNIKEQYMLDLWIDADVKHALRKTNLEALSNIKKLIVEYGVKCDLDKCIEDAEIRLDFAAALRNAKRGTDLSHKLGYGFGSEDLMELMKLHKSNKFRRKIEDLLTDCNFHSECSLLSERKYDEFAKFVAEND